MTATDTDTRGMRFLIIRFRQLGDTVLTTPLADTLKATFPDCRVDIVLMEPLAPLLANHPSYDNIITFTYEECHKPLTYVRKIWHTVRSVRYDAIIDLRSTMNTAIFSLLSPRTPRRIGIRRWYTKLAFTHSTLPNSHYRSAVSYNLGMLESLSDLAPIVWRRSLTLYSTEQEKTSFKQYMQRQGIDFTRPVMLAGVTARLTSKTWPMDRVTEVLRRLTNDYPDLQIVLNYAPGREAEEAKAISDKLNRKSVFINIEAKGIRRLMAMASCCTFYFGNEGGTRHIVDAMGKPTFSICAPSSWRAHWVPLDDPRHQALAAEELTDPTTLATLTYEQKYDLITTDIVYSRLQAFIEEVKS